jgi:hypothetical protein
LNHHQNVQFVFHLRQLNLTILLNLILMKQHKIVYHNQKIKIITVINNKSKLFNLMMMMKQS